MFVLCGGKIICAKYGDTEKTEIIVCEDSFVFAKRDTKLSFRAGILECGTEPVFIQSESKCLKWGMGINVRATKPVFENRCASA